MKQIRHPIVYKFGGTIFGGKNYPEEFSKAAEYLIRQQDGYKPVCVVSAPKGVTNMLIDLWNKKYDDNVYETFVELAKKCKSIAGELDDLDKRLEEELNKLDKILMKGKERDEAILIGENISGISLTHYLNKLGCGSVYLDGYEAGVVVNSLRLPEENESIKNLRKSLNRYLKNESKTIPIIGGFGGKCKKTGKYKTMIRNSTDVTAALCGAALEAGRVKILKNTPGIFRVEPWFGDYGVVPYLSYGEAGELGRRGVESVHPLAVNISERHKIPIEVTTLLENQSTLISDKSSTTYERFAAALSVRPVYILTISDPTLESSGYIRDASEVLSNYGISILDVFCSWNTLSFTIGRDQKSVNGQPIEKVMENYLKAKGRKRTKVKGRDIHTISIVGDAIRNRYGTLEYVSGLLGEERINIECYQGSDEAISPEMVFGVKDEDVKNGVKALCEALFLN